MGQDWYTELYDEMTPKLAKFIYLKIGDWERAMDLTQDVWVKHYKKFKDVIDRGPSIPDEDLTYQKKWLYTTAKYARIDELRKKDVQTQYVQSVDPDEDDDDPSPEDSVVRKEACACVQRVLASMSNKHAEILKLKDVLGYSYSEIADIVGMSRNSIGTSLTRARDAFEEFLQEICPDLYLEQTT